MHKKRYIENSFKEKHLDMTVALEQIKDRLQDVFEEYDIMFDKSSKIKIYSDNTQKIDTSLYTGSGGVIYTYYKLYQYYSTFYPKAEITLDIQQKFEQGLQQNIHLVETDKDKRGRQSPSFFMSVAGLYTVGMLYYQRVGDEKQCIQMVDELIRHFEFFENDLGQKYVEDEVLYGIAGYLYCLLMILKYIDSTHKKALALTKRIVDAIIEDGLDWSQSPDHILIKWPRDRKEHKFYLGGAHGLMGVLQMLLQAVNISQELQSDKQLMAIIQNSCEYLLNLQFESGNFPSSLGKKDDILVHFCHGSTGAVPFLVSAYQTFKDPRYLESLIKTGELIWERGILKKGNGICHGISGNGYALHSIYRQTRDEKWLRRSIFYGMATFDKVIQKEIRHYEDPGRMKMGMPDTPYSLMEGQGGEICYLVDLALQNHDEVKFPGYEILF